MGPGLRIVVSFGTDWGLSSSTECQKRMMADCSVVRGGMHCPLRHLEQSQRLPRLSGGWRPVANRRRESGTWDGWGNNLAPVVVKQLMRRLWRFGLTRRQLLRLLQHPEFRRLPRCWLPPYPFFSGSSKYLRRPEFSRGGHARIITAHTGYLYRCRNGYHDPARLSRPPYASSAGWPLASLHKPYQLWLPLACRRLRRVDDVPG